MDRQKYMFSRSVLMRCNTEMKDLASEIEFEGGTSDKFAYGNPETSRAAGIFAGIKRMVLE